MNILEYMLSFSQYRKTERCNFKYKKVSFKEEQYLGSRQSASFSYFTFGADYIEEFSILKTEECEFLISTSWQCLKTEIHFK